MSTTIGPGAGPPQVCWRDRLRAERRQQDRRDALRLIDEAAGVLSGRRHPSNHRLADELAEASRLLEESGLLAVEENRPHHHWQGQARDWKAADLGPTSREAAILNKIEKHGGLQLHFHRDRRRLLLWDGGPIERFDFNRALRLGWLVADSTMPGLFPEGPSLRYVVTGNWRRP